MCTNSECLNGGGHPIRLCPNWGQATYIATLARDTREATAAKIEHATLCRKYTLYINLRSGGGFVGRFMQ